MVAASLGMRLAAQCTCPLTFDASPLAYIGLDTTFVVGWDGRSTWILRERKTEIGIVPGFNSFCQSCFLTEVCK